MCCVGDALSAPLAVWFIAVRTQTGTDVFTERLVDKLKQKGIRAEVAWLPLRAEYAPWLVAVPVVPEWATVVHVNTWLHSRFLPKNLPIISTIHHAVHHIDASEYKGILRRLYHQLWIAPNERRVMRRSQKVIAVSQFVADTAHQTLVDMPMQVIYNGVNTQIFKQTINQNAFLPPLRLLYVGSWMSRKGVDLLPKIMRELEGLAELYFTGGAAAEKDKPTMPSNMHDIGRLQGDEAVAKAMQQADALLFPTRSEGFGLVAAEAMACGLAVITTDYSSLPEVVLDKKTGYLCPRDDVASFVNAVKSLIANPDERVKMAALSQERVASLFSEDAMIDSYLSVYRALCSAEIEKK